MPVAGRNGVGSAAAADRVRAVLAADCACAEGCFTAAGVHVVEAALRPGRRRFPWREPSLLAVTLGAGAVVSASPAWLAWARERLGGRSRDEVFAGAALAEMASHLRAEGQTLAGPYIGWVCAADGLRGPEGVAGATLRLVEGAGVAELYRHEGFGHALGYAPGGARPDVLACVALDPGGAVVALAGASADCDDLWQVGVDVLPAWRGRGLGRAVVAAVTEGVLARGRLPYYTTAPSNVASGRLALAVGYRPCWAQVHAVERKEGGP